MDSLFFFKSQLILFDCPQRGKATTKKDWLVREIITNFLLFFVNRPWCQCCSPGHRCLCLQGHSCL